MGTCDTTNIKYNKYIRMYCRSGTGLLVTQKSAATWWVKTKHETLLHRRFMLSLHSPGSSTFLCEVTSWPPSWKYDVISDIWLHQSMRIQLQNIPDKFYPNPISNEGEKFLKTVSHSPQQEEQQQDDDDLQYEISSWSKVTFLELGHLHTKDYHWFAHCNNS